MKFVGSGTYLPERIRTSAELDERFGKPAGWTEEKFGISARHIAAPHETSSYMGAKAAEAAITEAGWDKGAFDVLIGACAVMEQPIPSTSILIQNSLGLGRSGISAFDINQTCLSFLTALDVAAMGITAGRWSRVLIVSSDIASAGLDYSVPETAAIFGDGAAAICVEKVNNAEGSELLSRRFETYGYAHELAVLRSGGTKIRVEEGFDALLAGSKFEMDAFGIFKAAARHLPKIIDGVLEEAKLDRTTVDFILCHQASAPGVAHIKKLFRDRPERVINIFSTHGNQIAASLPSVLASARAAGHLTSGKTILLLGTAAGISAGAMVLRV